MPYDNPFNIPDPFAQANTQLGIAQRPQQQQALPPLSPQEESSLLDKIGSGALGGLGWIAGMLNKPGRAVRGLLGGTPREALNLIPFSDALGITDATQEVRGQDLLGAKDADFISPEGLAGFGVDVLTDPLTYLSFGGSALSKAGLAAKKAGVLPKTIAERAAHGLGGHVGVGLPFGENLATANLAPLGNAIKSGIEKLPGGEALTGAVGSMGNAIGDLYTKTIPPLFQKSVLGQTDAGAQAVAREVSGVIPGAQAAARKKVMDITGMLPESGLTQAGARDLRQGLESLAPVSGELAPAIGAQKSYQAFLLGRIKNTGFNDSALADDAVGYAPRQATLMNKKEANALEASLHPAGQVPSREQMLKGLPTEGAGSINDLTRREDLLPVRQAYTAGDKAPLENLIKKDYVKVDDAEILSLRQQLKQHQQLGSYTVPSPDMEHLASLEAKAKQAENLASWLATSVPEDLAKAGLGFFDRHPHIDLVDKAVRDETRILKAEGLHKALAKMAAPGEGAPLSQVLEKAGLTFKDATGQSVAMTRTMEALQAEGKLGAGATLKDLEGLTVPLDQVDKLARFTQAATSPAGLKPVLDIFDSITNLTKGFQTALWPANWVRNQTQAIFQNWVHDAKYAHEIGPAAYVKPFIDAKAWRDGGVISGASKIPGMEHLGEEAASAALHKEIAAYKVAGGFGHSYADIAGGELTTKQLLPELPGQARKPFATILKDYVPTSKAAANPLGVAGVGQSLTDTFAPIKAGRELNQELDAVNRVATYLAKRSQGFTPEAALSEVKLAHFDFGNLSGFEKGVMKRIVPFYSWARQNIPAVLGDMVEHPGGKTAQAVRATQEAKGTHPGFIRPDIAEGVSVPIGSEENGTQRYLSHLGLGFEDLGQLLGPGGAAGSLNPLLKLPYEQITGRQANTGRDLRDLHSRLGDMLGTPMPFADNLIMNSPAGRLETTLGTIGDARKSIPDKLLNLLTGTRVSDVNADAARRVAVRDFISNQLHGPGFNHFEGLSIRPDQAQNLTPLEQDLYRLYRSQQARRQ